VLVFFIQYAGQKLTAKAVSSSFSNQHCCHLYRI